MNNVEGNIMVRVSPRPWWIGAVCIWAIVLGAGVQADDRKEDVAAIHENAAQFADAFAAGDAGAIADLFTESAEYVTADGRTLRGREQIEADFAEFFADNGGLQLTIAIDDVRFLAPTVATEEGRTWTLEAPVGEPRIGRYSAVHAKVGDRWLVARVRESEEVLTSNYERLQQLEWLVGEWKAESETTTTEVQVEWAANKNFLKQTFKTRRESRVVASGTQIIGWDPRTNQIVSWMFDSGGGHGNGVLRKEGGRVVVQTSSVLSDGSEATATNSIVRTGDHTFEWSSTNRAIGDQPLADVGPITVHRQTEISAQ